MFTNVFGLLRKPPLLKAPAVWLEADILEAAHGTLGAVRHVRSLIAQAPREQRPRLYRLHDEIARRRPEVMARVLAN